MDNQQVNVGEAIPYFELQDQNGNLFKIADVIGIKKLVIFFYPKDFTPGCIKEVCSFRDHYTIFTDHNIDVIGISSDTAASHQKFAIKYKLPFKILSDTNASVRKLLGVSTSLFGLLPGIETFVVDLNGIVTLRFNNQFGAQKHIQESLKILGIK